LLLALFLLLVSWLLYHRAFGLAFFWDDASNLREVRDQSLVHLFTRGYYYHRPVVLVLWKGMARLVGYQGAWFHALNVMVHGVNGLLVWRLVRLFSGRELLAFLSALLFVAHPFAYQAVAYVGALFHPFTTLLVLAALFSYETFRRQPRRGLFWIAHGLLALAYFSHESAFVAPVLLLALDLSQGRDVRPSLSLFAVALVAFVLWLMVPKGAVGIAAGQGLPLPLPPSIGQRLFYALRAVLYPLIPLQALLSTAFRWDAGAVLTALGLVGVLVGLVAARSSPLRHLFGLAAVWIFACPLPAILFVETPYVREGHRLFYFSSVGATLLWALVFTSPVYALRRRRSSLVAQGVVVTIPLLLLAQNGWFIQERLADYERASLLVRRIAQTATEIPPDRAVVYVNLPQFFAPQSAHPATSPEAYGFREVWVIPAPFTELEDLIRINGGPYRQASGVFVKALGPHWLPYGTEITLDELRQLLQRDVVLLFDPARWDFVNLSAGWFPGAEIGVPTPARLFDPVRFGKYIALEGAQLDWQPQEVRVTLWWRSLTPVDEDYTVFTHLYDAGGRLVAQHDGMPVQGVVPTTLWRPGDLIRDVHVISLPDGLRPGRYTLAVGLYNLATMRRLPAITEAGRPFQENRVPLGTREYPW